MMRRKLLKCFWLFALLMYFPLQSNAATVYDFPASDPAFTIPVGVTLITVHVWGAGGGGGGAQANAAAGQAGGGGGGAYAMKDFTVIPLDPYPVVVDAGGSGGVAAGGNGSDGGASSFSGPAGSVAAAGGSGGGGSIGGIDGAGGAGGLAGVSGDVNYSGGAGAAGAIDSGGGGGAAGTEGNGGNAGSPSTSDGGAGRPSLGGNGAAGFISQNVGANGSIYGGGGSGAFGDIALDRTGGNGAAGFVRVICHAAAIGITKDRNLSFGSFVVGGAGDTVSVAADFGGIRSGSAGTVLIGANGSRSAEFTVSGEATGFVAMITPAVLSDGTNNIPVNFSIGYDNRNNASIGKVYVGGTLIFAGTEPPGAYTANSTITVAYE